MTDSTIPKSVENLFEHICKNGVDLEMSKATLGVSLEFDSKSETFTGDRADEANALATGDYREGHMLPEIV